MTFARLTRGGASLIVGALDAAVPRALASLERVLVRVSAAARRPSVASLLARPGFPLAGDTTGRILLHESGAEERREQQQQQQRLGDLPIVPLRSTGRSRST